MHQKLQKGGTQIVTELGSRVVLLVVLVVWVFFFFPNSSPEVAHQGAAWVDQGRDKSLGAARGQDFLAPSSSILPNLLKPIFRTLVTDC